MLSKKEEMNEKMEAENVAMLKDKSDALEKAKTLEA